MVKKKLNYVDKGINTTILAIITIILGFIAIIALATHYIIGTFVSVIFMAFVYGLLKSVDIDAVIEFINTRKW